MKGRTDLATPNNANGDSHEKTCYETRRSMVKTRKFYMKLFMSICTRDTLSHKCLKADYSQLRFDYAKLFDTPEEDRQVLGFVKPVLDSYYENEDNLETEKSFSSVFNTFANQ